MIPVIVHTHSDYFDILSLFIQNIKYINSELFDIHFLSNVAVPGTDYKTIIYPEKMPYAKRWQLVIEKLNTKNSNLILLHEDFIPYKYVNIERINKLNQFLANSNYNYIRFMRAESLLIPSSEPNLWSSQHSFAIQASLFNINFLYNYMSNYNSILDLETNYMNIPTNGLYWYDNEPKRGQAHYDSNLFPCMATAVYKGKWHTEYINELVFLREMSFFDKRGWTL